MPKIQAFLGFAIVAISNIAVAADLVETRVCNDFTLIGEETIRFSNSEIRLLCGDKQTKDWRKIPRSQAMFNLRNFLQARGYQFPREVPGPQGVLKVELGPPTLVTGLELVDMPEGLDGWTAKEFNGDRMTPDLLNLITERITHRLGVMGFACPELETHAHAESGIVSVRLKKGTAQNLVEVAEEKIKELLPGTLRRFDAFVIGKPYNIDSMTLTSNRAVNDGIVQNTYFNTKCTDNGVVARQEVLAGKPREVTIGFGFNTDRGASARASWKHSRLGERGSTLWAGLTLAYKGHHFNTQQLDAQAAWYFLQEPSRVHLKPRLLLKRQSDNRLDVLSAELGLSPATTWDGQNVGGYVSLGPMIRGERTLRGEGRPQTYFLTLLGELTILSHEYELQRTEPKSGFESTTAASFSRKGFLSDYSATYFRSRFTHLWRVWRMSRRNLIFGVRSEFATTLVDQDEGGLANLPPTLRHYLGGSGNLRGFSFQELPGPSGALSSFFTGGELRGTGYLPLDLQPYVFVDLGTVSPNSIDFSQTWFASPGFGLRWPSPLGVFRLSVAHGFALGIASSADPRSHWQMHFTYGEEF